VLGPRAIGTDLLTAARARNYRRGANVVGADAGYIRASGTSFAAPLVAGAASLLLAVNPALGPAEVERMLLHSARDIEAPGVDHLTGYGRLDAAAALAADPAFYVEAAIDRVEVASTARGPVARLVGTADAEKFAGARIEIGAGEAPSGWKAVEGGPARPVRHGVIGEIPAAAFQGSAVWTLRVTASHANGRTREARYLLRLN
jgi:subtilisin family serine protease